MTDSAAQLRSLRAAARQKGVEIDTFAVPEDRQAILGSLRFHYLDWGGPAGRTIVFAHGFALNAHTWDLVCLALRPEHRCVALDMRGHGDSEWAPGLHYDIASMAGDLEALIAMLGADRPILVGMSMGGVAALRYATAHSRLLGGLVVIEAGARPRPLGVERVRAFVERTPEHDSVEDFVQEAMRFNSRRDPELLRSSLRHNLRQVWNGRWTWKYDRRHLGDIPGDGHLRELDALAIDSAAIACPTLIVRGADSDLFTAEDAAAVVGRIAGAREVVVEEAGHNVQGDNPRGLVDALRGFLAEIARGPA